MTIFTTGSTDNIYIDELLFVGGVYVTEDKAIIERLRKRNGVHEVVDNLEEKPKKGKK